MSFQGLSQHLTTLQESNAQLHDLIDRLATIKFQPGSVPLNDNEEGNVMSELASEISQTLKDQEEDFELLVEEVLDLPSGWKGSALEQEKMGLHEAVRRSYKELKSFNTSFRRAILSARRSLTAAQRKERRLLLQSFVEPRSSNASPALGMQRRTQKPPLSKEEKTLNTSSDVTLALRRTHDMMASELSRSQFAHDTLKESTAALADLSETYSTLDTMLSSSKNLLGTLLKSQKSDTWYLETAFYILCCTIAWLVWRRILYGPTWWLLWFPMKMFIKGWMGVFGAMGLRGGSGNSDKLSSSSVISITSPTVYHKSATRGYKPTGGPPRGTRPVGGKGAPIQTMDERSHSEEILSEKVGRTIDESQGNQAKNDGEKDVGAPDSPEKII